MDWRLPPDLQQVLKDHEYAGEVHSNDAALQGPVVGFTTDDKIVVLAGLRPGADQMSDSFQDWTSWIVIADS